MHQGDYLMGDEDLIRRHALIARIATAFAMVSLGKGRTLDEAMAIDDRLSDEDIKAARLVNPHSAWTEVDRAFLAEKYESALSFLDPEGFRFYLPAYMTASLEGLFDFGSLVFHLTQLSGRSMRKTYPQDVRDFYGFTDIQCEVISLYLRYAFDLLGGRPVEQEMVERWEKFVDFDA